MLKGQAANAEERNFARLEFIYSRAICTYLFSDKNNNNRKTLVVMFLLIVLLERKIDLDFSKCFILKETFKHQTFILKTIQ